MVPHVKRELVARDLEVVLPNRSVHLSGELSDQVLEVSAHLSAFVVHAEVLHVVPYSIVLDVLGLLCERDLLVVSDDPDVLVRGVGGGSSGGIPVVAVHLGRWHGSLRDTAGSSRRDRALCQADRGGAQFEHILDVLLLRCVQGANDTICDNLRRLVLLAQVVDHLIDVQLESGLCGRERRHVHRCAHCQPLLRRRVFRHSAGIVWAFLGSFGRRADSFFLYQ